MNDEELNSDKWKVQGKVLLSKNNLYELVKD